MNPLTSPGAIVRRVRFPSSPTVSFALCMVVSSVLVVAACARPTLERVLGENDGEEAATAEVAVDDEAPADDGDDAGQPQQTEDDQAGEAGSEPDDPDENATPADTTPPPTTEPEKPEIQRPPGTVNDLDDLIGNERRGGVDGQRDDTLADRFAQALVESDSGLDVTDVEAECIGALLDERLSPVSFELLITNIESFGEIEQGRQFTDAELLVISESFADCLDLREIVQDAVGGDAFLEALTDCIAAELDIDAVESLILAEFLGRDDGRTSSPLALAGLDVCPLEARAVMNQLILSHFLLDDVPAVEACLAGINNAELRPFFETRELGELITQLREQCLL